MWRALWIAAALGLAACGRHAGPAASLRPGRPGSGRHAAPAASASARLAAGGRGDAEAVLNIYNWADYIAPDIVPNFEKEYGIKVHYDMFDANTVLQTKLLTGKTGYDIVVPSASFMAPQIKAGVFQKLDRAQLPEHPQHRFGARPAHGSARSRHGPRRQLFLGHFGDRLQRRQDQGGDAGRAGGQPGDGV